MTWTTDWLKDCKDLDEVDARKKMVLSAAPTLRILHKLMESKLKEEQEGQLRRMAYESPSWAYTQADSIGAIRTLKYVLSLLDQEEFK